MYNVVFLSAFATTYYYVKFHSLNGFVLEW